MTGSVASTACNTWVRSRAALFVAAVLTCLGPADAHAGLNRWTSGGPEGGLIRSVVVDPKTSGVVYAVTSGGGVFKSATGGSFWTPIDNGFTTLQAQVLAIDPTSPGVLYAGTFIGGLFKSTNGGVSWAPSNAGLGFPDPRDTLFAIAIDPKTPTTLYAGTGSGRIFKSTNAGASWSQVFRTSVPPLATTFAPVFSLTVDPVTPTTVYAATLGTGVLKSVDGGASWNPVNSGLGNLTVPVLAIDPKAPATLYAATFGGGVFKSVNGGGSWTPINNGLPDALRATTVTVDPQATQTLYVGTLASGAFKSTNGGGSWFAVNTGKPAASFVTSIAVDPKSSATVYSGAFGSGVFKSTNGGDSWSASNAGLGAAFILALADLPGQSALFAGTYRQKLFRSTNGGASWKSSSAGITDQTVNAVAVVPSPFNFVGVQATVYAGTSQHSVFLSAGNLGPEGNLVIGPPGAGNVFKSTDGGVTWNRTNVPTVTAVQALAADPVIPLTVYAGTLGDGVFKSTDGGVSWSQMNLGLADRFVFSLAIDGAGAVYAGTSSGVAGPVIGRVYKSTNGGATWSATNLPVIDTPVVALALGPSTVYAATWGSGVFKTINGGASWSSINTGLFNQADTSVITIFALAVEPLNPSTVYAGSFDTGVFRSTNAGASWAQSNVGLPDDSVVHALALNAAGTCVHAGTGGSVYDFATQASPDCPPPPTLAASFSTTSQSVAIGAAARTVATVRNLSGTADADARADEFTPVGGITCGVNQLTSAPTNFTFQPLDPVTNQPIADPNTPVDIAPGSGQPFEIILTPQEPVCALDVQFGFNCSNARPADIVSGANTLLLTAGCALSASVSVNQPTFAVGQTLTAGGSVTNPGLPGTAADFYVGLLRPDNIIEFLTPTGIVLGNAANPGSFRPLAVNVPLATPFSVNQPSVVTRPWTAGDPRGQYVFFLAVVKAGALADGVVGNDEILRIATASLSFP